MPISSEVTYGAGRPELYRELSAAEDRAMTDTGSQAMPESLPSFQAERVDAPGYEDYIAAALAFDKDMFGFDEALMSDTPVSRYLLVQQGVPWPTPWSPPNYTDPTVLLLKNSINQGWNAGSQAGPAPGYVKGLSGLGQCGCGCGPGPCRCGLSGCAPRSGLSGCGCRFGSLGTDDDLDFDLHTTAGYARGKRLSGLQGLGADVETPSSTATRAAGMQKVLAAAAMPTTKANRDVTRKLLDQSVKVADRMETYANIAQKADTYAKLALKKAGVADARTQEIVQRLFDPETGDVRPEAHPADVERLRRLRREAFEAGREAVRAQKAKLLAEGQAQNAYAQAAILQKMAATTVGGQPDATAVYAKMFDKIGQESAALRGIRERQKANWIQREVQELNGLEDLDAIDNRIEGADYWEAELDGFEIVEDAYLGELEGWLKRRIKKAAKKVKKAAKRSVKVVGRAAKSATKAATKAAQVAAQRAAQAAVRSAKAAAKRAASAAARAASKIANSTVAKNFMKVATPVAKSIRSVAKVAIEPVRMSVTATGRAIKGDFKGALSSVKKSAKATMNGLSDVVRNGVFGVACGLENTRLGRAAAQAVGQAIGTVYGGGQAGGAVGREAGRKANDINRGMCKGMKQLGLTGEQKLSLSAKNLKRSLKVSARDLKRTTFSKQAMLASALRIAQNAALGGAGSSLPGADALKNFGTKQFTDLGVKTLKDQGQKFLKKKGTQILGRALKRTNIPGANLVAGAARAYATGGQQALLRQVSSPQALATRARAEALAYAKKQARARAIGIARQQAQKRVQASVPAAAQLLARQFV